ncbi:MAG: PDGLE domain-containing protein [Dehalococcoidia bacterium]|nr:PDGLE domain-containing protein [Dehalococcoidia bacterium]
MAQRTTAQSFLKRWWWVIAGVVIACAVVIILAPAASSDPDGLDRVSGDEGFSEKADESPYEWLPDYSIPGVNNERASVVLAGLVGVGIVFVLTFGFGALARHSRRGGSA